MEKALATGRIGRPVAVRAFLQWTADHGVLTRLAADACDAAARWFESAVTACYARGGAAEGYVSVLAEYARGETALVAAEVLREGPAATLVLVVGNRGTLQFDDAAPEQPGDSPLRALIERSLATGRVERANAG
ncbi:MAG: hypothetical protein ACRD96_13760 [Bryobacteraceae bacterium]